jgi:methylase of polypeptide subunit release factors
MVALGRLLQKQNYKFITVTPESHKRILKRKQSEPITIRDIFGWSKQFPNNTDVLDSSMIESLRSNRLLSQSGNDLKSTVRFSSAASLKQTSHTDPEMLFMHSSFPTEQEQSIFFGPDSYRYLNFLRDKVGDKKFKNVVDIGAGSGVGGLFFKDNADQIILTDINDAAFQYAAVNAELNNCADKIKLIKSDIMKDVEKQEFDLIVSNPPYMVDTSRDVVRAYRNGGGDRGIDLSVRIVRESIPFLAHGGILALYTGVPIVNGVDVFWDEIKDELKTNPNIEQVDYYEIDVDVFGEELSTEVYGDVDRIAVTGLTLKMK